MLRGKFELNIDQVFLAAKRAKIIDKLEDELYSFARLIEDHYEFKLFIEDPRISADYKKKMLAKLCPPGLSQDFIDLIEMLIDNGREELVAPLAAGLAKRLFKETGILFGEVLTAVPLAKSAQDKLSQTMTQLIKRPIKLRYSLKPEILGGFIVNFINGETWDASLRHKLNELKTAALN